MNDYSDIIYTMGALIIFSMLSLQATRMLVQSDQLQVESEIEYNAVALAQDFIDQIKWVDSEAELDAKIASFPKSVDANIGDGTLTYYVSFDVHDIIIPDSNVNNKLVTVSIKNKYLGRNAETDEESSVTIQQNFVKSFAP